MNAEEKASVATPNHFALGAAPKLRVVEVLRGLAPGGAELATLRRLERAPDWVDTKVLVCSEGPDELSSRYSTLRGSLHHQGSSLRAIRAAAALARTRRVDVVVIHSPRELALTRLFSFGQSVPLVMIAHGSHAGSISKKYGRLVRLASSAVLRLASRKATCHFAVSEIAAQGPQCRGARRVVVVPLGSTLETGLEPAHQEKAPWPRGCGLKLLVVGRLASEKNLESLISAVASLAKPLRDRKAHLILVGDGPIRPALESLVSTLGCEDLVSFPGFQPHPAEYFRQADLLIVPSHAEGGPLVIYEALLAGTRVLSTHVGVAPEALRDDPVSLIVPSGTPDDLLAGLERFLFIEPCTEHERRQRARKGSEWDVATTTGLFYSQLLHLCARSSLGSQESEADR